MKNGQVWFGLLHNYFAEINRIDEPTYDPKYKRVLYYGKDNFYKIWNTNSNRIYLSWKAATREWRPIRYIAVLSDPTSAKPDCIEQVIKLKNVTELDVAKGDVSSVQLTNLEYIESLYLLYKVVIKKDFVAEDLLSITEKMGIWRQPIGKNIDMKYVSVDKILLMLKLLGKGKEVDSFSIGIDNFKACLKFCYEAGILSLNYSFKTKKNKKDKYKYMVSPLFVKKE